MRNPNGYGTVYKLSGNRRRPYVARVTTGWTEDGRQTYKLIGYFADRSEALFALAEYNKAGVRQGRDMTLFDVYQAWSRIHYENIAEKTRKNYEISFRKLESVQHMPVSALKTAHFDHIIRKEKLTNASARLVKILLNQLYQYALENDIVSKNYAAFIKLPKSSKKQKEIFSDAEIKKLWENQDNASIDTILILIYTGLRIGELLSLTKSHVDLENQLLTGGIKTDAGKDRIVPIHPRILPFIQTYCQLADPYLFPFPYRQYLAKFKQALSQIGITGKTPHCTRHTFATLMARGGADVIALQNIIGHSQYATTADIYTHLGVDDLKKAIGSI